MEEQTEKVLNPYERLKFLEEKINSLSKEELDLKEYIRKGINKKASKERLDEVESEELFLIIEQDCLKNCVNWFEIYVLGFRKAQENKDGN